LGLGAWVALDLARRNDRPPRAARAWVLLVAAAAWIGLALVEARGPLTAGVAVWRQVLQGVVFAWIVGRAVSGFSGVAGRGLAHPAAIGVGRISYGAYLIHAFAPVVVFAVARALGVEAWVPASALARAALYGATTLALAGLMWRCLERPVLSWKSRVPYA
jgi:peptidoglycan/LPS O-acetylase OafA/YrhL